MSFSDSCPQVSAQALPPGGYAENGAGIGENGQYVDVFGLFRQAAERGDADAQYYLGTCYRYGEHVGKDDAKALYWYRRAASQGHIKAQEVLQVLEKAAVPVDSPLYAAYADEQAGGLFEFGRWPQGLKGEVLPITWRVLRRDADSLLAVAEKGLECKPFHENYCRVSWMDCSLRRWLNDDFYTFAFEEEERSLILPSRICNNACPATEDSVFLLSVDEAESLFADDNDRRAEAADFAVANGVNAHEGRCFWWLRSRGSYDINTADVDDSGIVNSGGSNVNYRGSAVRPALRLVL